MTDSIDLTNNTRGPRMTETAQTLAMLSSSSNQEFIFATNKLREIVGASELIREATIGIVLNHLSSASSTEVDRRAPTCNDELRERISHISRVQIVSLSSGKAILLFEAVAETNTEARQQANSKAKAFIASVTSEILSKHWGITITGAFLPLEMKVSDDTIQKKLVELSGLLDRAARHLPAARERSPRYPVVADCLSSGLPAHHYDTQFADEKAARSRAVMAKRKARDNGLRRIYTLASSQAVFAKGVNELDSESQRRRKPNFNADEYGDELKRAIQNSSWVAVIHIDGNGIGSVFRDFLKMKPENYCVDLLKFSLDVDELSERAFRQALDETGIHKSERVKGRKRFVIPVVLGGDDLTVIADGYSALPFTKNYLAAFDEQAKLIAKKSPIFAKALDDLGRLTACAGVAIVKPHFPFSIAYQLAEELTASAKQVKKASNKHSALDFHVHYDSSGTSLNEIRQKLLVDHGDTQLSARPYVIAGETALESKSWLEQHDFRKLSEMVDKVNKTNERAERVLSSKQLHELRDALHEGRRVANAKFRFLKADVRNSALASIGESETSLFTECVELSSAKTDNPTKHLTYLLDALEIAEIWERSE